ncbi:MAG: MAM protein [Flavobacterium sp.]|nr:MAM protein [Flavobacterium sp.]
MEILNNGNNLSTTEYLSNTLFSPYNYFPHKDIVNTRYWLGRSEFWDASYDGDILEIINYNTRNSDADRNKIETYLAIKYGITLGVNGISKNYVNSDGATIYGAGAGFNYNIAGIGRDDKSQLNQKQSKTENTNSDITIGLGNIFDTNSNNTNAFDTDKKFLVWGHNNNTLDAQSPISVDMSSGITPAGSLITLVDFISIARTWRVIETGGDVPSVKVSIPSAILTATITPPGDFLMFVSDSPVFNPTAEYRIMRVNGSNLEADYDFTGTKYITFGYAPERTYPRAISFDGTNDYLDAGKVLNLDNTFTVSTWIKRNSANQTILSKRDNAFTTGYDLSINNVGKAEMSWINGTKQTITSSVAIPPGKWHNVAVTFDGTTAQLYIDGVLDVAQAMPTVPANTQSFLIAAADGVNTTSFFNGGIDEVRVWKVALTDKQLRYVMNQEINRNATFTGGTTIPNTVTLNEIGSIPWLNLSAYYPMSTYTFTNAKDVSANNYTAALKNLTTVDAQTAPLPYESTADGLWQTAATWLNNTVQDLPNSLSIVDGTTPVDWNIVKTNTNVSSTGNKTVLGLMVSSNTLSASNNSKIEVTNYLKLDGKMDLVGMSQLVQTLDCDLDVTSAGSIERDQQGQANKFNYNYWCSPVNPINPTANNTDYSVGGIMKDGFTATPRNINWIDGYDGAAGNATTPTSIARFWLNKFDNYSNLYANWFQITEDSALRVGQGFTMKGSGAASATQNITFVGKPNNGLIDSNTIATDQLLLSGNPYPSAMDANAFINDNIVATNRGIDGSIYFWEHYTTNNTHVLGDYQGGYAVRNLVGGIAPVSSDVDFISGLGSSTRIPSRYIPVGQGFFLNGSATGGTVIFKNSQRAFVKETDAVNSNTMFKKPLGVSKSNHWNDNKNDRVERDTIKRIRLGFNSNNNYHRQVLLGFMNDNATHELDYGYDALSLDDIPNDMYLLNGENQLVIQGEGYFDANATYPIGIKTDVKGNISFGIDALENFDSEQAVYIYDNDTDTYHNIRNEKFEISVAAGVNDTRFSLRFINKNNNSKNVTLGTNENAIDDIKITHIQNGNILLINNKLKDCAVEKVTLFNVLGQSLSTWKIENQDQQNIQIPIKNIPSGMYIAKVKTATGDFSKKIIIP